MDSKKLQILSEHYSHTFDFLQIHMKKRDTLFVLVLFVLLIMIFQIYAPSVASGIFSQLMEKKLEIKSQINFLFIQSTIWFFLFTLTIKYFQSVVFIERQYNYIHSLENVLSKEYEDKAFTREGKHYLNDYPAFLNWASILYTVFFPAILIAVATAKIVSEYGQYGVWEVLFWVDSLIYICIIVSIVMYLYSIYFKLKNT